MVNQNDPNLLQAVVGPSQFKELFTIRKTNSTQHPQTENEFSAGDMSKIQETEEYSESNRLSTASH